MALSIRRQRVLIPRTQHSMVEAETSERCHRDAIITLHDVTTSLCQESLKYEPHVHEIGTLMLDYELHCANRWIINFSITVTNIAIRR